MLNPKVSIIIPAYNKSTLTVKTINSVLNQTYNNIELIVVDDGSTDDTKEKILAFGNQLTYIYKENGGCCSARNVGWKQSSGEFIGFIDCDDMYTPDKVERCVQYLTEHPDTGMVHTAAYFIDETDDIIDRYSHVKSHNDGWITKKLLFGNFICNSTPFMRTKCIKEIGGFDESIFMPADWNAWLRISAKYPIGYLNMPLTKYRVVGNYTFNHLEKAKEEEAYVIQQFFKEHVGFSSFFQKQVWSDFYLRYAQCDFIKNENEDMKVDFVRSIQNNPLNLKAVVLLLYYLIAKKSLQFHLRKRILRTIK